MPSIRLLQSIVGTGPVIGDPGDVLDVDDATAAVWADDVRAEVVAAALKAPATTAQPRTGVRTASRRAPEVR